MDRLIAANSVPLAQADTAPATGTPQYATDGNPASNVPATRWPAYAFNAIQDEIYNVIIAAGLTPDRTKWNQLITAIQALTQQGGPTYAQDTGSANTVVASLSPAITSLSSGMKVRIHVAANNTGASTLDLNGLGALPIYGFGGSALQEGELKSGVVAEFCLSDDKTTWVLQSCEFGALQIAPATQSKHAVQFGQVSGVVGSMRNAKMSVAAASSTASWSADEIVLETALGGLRYCVGNASGTINLATTGVGGMDVGSAPTNGYVAIYAAYDPTTQTFNLIAQNATSSSAPNVYAGGHMPAGYSASALVSVWPTNGSGQFIAGFQLDRDISIPLTQVFSGSTQKSSYTSLSVSSVIPANARSISGVFQVGSSAAANCVLSVAGSSFGAGAQNVGSSVSGGTVVQGSYSKVPILDQQALYYTATAVTGTMSSYIGISGYSI